MTASGAGCCIWLDVESRESSVRSASGRLSYFSWRIAGLLGFSILVLTAVCILSETAMAAPLIISEFRLRGPNGANDEFVEIYNSSDADVTVNAADGSSGFALAASDGVTRFVILNGTVIPGRGHYLGVNSVGYSLASYPAGNGTTATGDATFVTGITDNAGIALFSTSNPANFSLAYRLDAAGSTSEANTLYKEGTGYPALAAFSIDYSFVRDECGNGGAINVSLPCDRSTPKDTDSNAADFIFVDTNGTSAGAGQRLGAPGPQNLSSPVRNSDLISDAALDTCASIASAPNRVRDYTSDPANNSTFGTLELRRTFTNSAGAPVTRLRFSIINQSTFPAPSGIADMRARTSTNIVVTVDRPTCGSGTSNVIVWGTTLEQPPSQPNGGAFNSTLSSGTVTLGTPLAAGASINLRFLFGLQQTGNYRIAINAESLPGGGAEWIIEGNTETGGEIEGGSSVPAAAGDLIISEFRLRGPNGANDEFVEIHNTLPATVMVYANDGSSGFALAASNGVARFVIPNGTLIPAGGHYLGVNSIGYSLASYPAGNSTTATGDITYVSDIPDNAGIALFKTSTPANFSLANRLDAVGSTSEASALYKEGSGYPALTPFSIDYSFMRDECGNSGVINSNIPCSRSTPKDSNNNSADFIFVDTNGTSAGAGQRLGSPGPENRSAPLTSGESLLLSLLDSTELQSASPNAARDFTSDPANNSTFGTISYRLRVANNTGVPIFRLRFRVVDLTTFPAPSGISDLRPRTSGAIEVSGINDPATCDPLTVPCAVSVQGTTLEQPPSQPNGGGFNTSMGVESITLGAPLAPGSSANVQILIGLQQTGCSRLGILAEALPGGSSGVIMLGGENGAGNCITEVISSNPGGHGAISCSSPAAFDSPSTCTMTPVSGWYLSSLTDNSTDVMGSAVYGSGQWTYTIGNVDSDHDVQSGFAEYKARRTYDGISYDYANTITELYSTAPFPSIFTIFSRRPTFIENVLFNRPNTVFLSGGWGSGFGGNAGNPTTIQGSLTIRRGLVQVEKIIIR